jgi:HlyD family secretion protein
MSSTQQQTTPNQKTGRSKSKRWPWFAAAAAVVVLLGVFLVTGLTGDDSANSGQYAVFSTQRGPLTINVSATGDLSSQEATIIRNPVGEDTTVLTLVDQGTEVEKGDVIAELDASTFEDERDQLLLDVESAQAEKVTAEQNLEITKQQNEASILDARVQYELAKLDFRQYLGAPPPPSLTAETGGQQAELLDEGGQVDRMLDGQSSGSTSTEDAAKQAQAASEAYQQAMKRIEKLNSIPLGQTPDYERLMAKMTSGEGDQNLSEMLEQGNTDFDRQLQQLLDQMEGQYKQNVQADLNTIRIAQSELKRAVDQLAGSIRLERKGYITETELEADRLEVKRLQSELQQGRGALRLRRAFTFQRELANLRNQLEQREFTVQQAKAEGQSNLVEAEANLKSRKSRLEQLRSRLKEAQRRIKACTVRAPKDGVVVYVEPDHSWDEIISEGAEVDDRQKMFRLPSSDQMVATVNLHQSVVDKVEAGMEARVTSSGSEQSFTGQVRKVNRLPDTDSSRRAANQKIYKAEIVVDSDGQLRPGMSVTAEIIVDQFDEATYVPLQAVVRRNGQPTVYLQGPNGLTPKQVKVGGANSEMIRVIDGLQPGQPVVLTPPLDSDEDEEPRMARAEDPSQAQGSDSGGDQADQDSDQADSENQSNNQRRGQGNQRRGGGRGGQQGQGRGGGAASGSGGGGAP